MTETTVLSVAAASRYAACHPKTLLRALQRQELRGYQRGLNCKWRIYQSDLDAYIRGEKPGKTRKAA
ncbi:MAG: hypothetical protein JWQ81_1703 [Amycolatopsis sp.]|jgi:excisionase family DNA binding protein|uniref:helix-turn-helix domain-containing protein n=1 Tax=Amycolatopsis sp. TaxID=37632 RepID=UPI002616A7C3|nr:helix-turn-helix domain-containing protein [Amycolatopsis sp.]MCU1680964.1 hypothetical protein [Amycolatopsis sp.]